MYRKRLPKLFYRQVGRGDADTAPFLNGIINMKLSVFLLFFLFVFTGCLLTVAAHAEEINKASGSRETSGVKVVELTPSEKAWLAAHPVITLGSTQVPPWDFADETTGQPEGIAPEYLELIGSKIGITFQYITDDFGKIQQMAKEKKIDGIRLLGKTEERAEYLNFTTPYVPLQYAIVTRHATEAVSGFADLVHKRVGTNKKTAANSYLQKNYPDIELVPINGYDDGLIAVLNNKVDAFVGPLATLNYTIFKNALSGLKVTAVPFELSKDMSFGVRKDWPELITIFNKAIEAIDRQEHIQIRSKWLGNSGKSVDVGQIILTAEEREWV